MLRRLLPTAALLTAGLLLLLWGLLGLARIFGDERQEAKDSLASRRQAMEQAAAETLLQLAESDLANARVRLRVAQADPLADARGLSYWAAGRQLFPLPRAEESVNGNATELLTALVAADDRTALARFVDAEPSPWNERLGWLESLGQALEAGDDPAIEAAVRGFLAHRQRYSLPASRDLPATLALAVAVQCRATPSSTFIRGLLLDGLDDGLGGRMNDLARDLLRQRHRFGSQDFAALSQQWLDLARAAAVPSAAFDQRLSDATTPPTGLPAALESTQLNGPALFRRQWLLAPANTVLADAYGNSQAPADEPLAEMQAEMLSPVLGVEIDFEDLVERTVAEMRALGLLAGDDILAIDPAPGELEPLSGNEAISLTVESPRWLDEAARIGQRYRYKVGLLMLSAVLAFTLNLLALWLMKRRHDFLALREGFVAAVSHELKTPLASIHLLAETLERRLQGRDEARDYPSRIVRQADGLAFLVDNLLSFNRLDKGRWQPRLEAVAVDELLSWLHTEARQAPRTVTLEVRGESGLEVHADVELLHLLLANLLRNSCQYNERDTIGIDIDIAIGDNNGNTTDIATGKTTDIATVDDGRLRLLWRDNGWGVDPADHLRVFNEFYRSEAASRRGVHGTGLGLAICRRIARLHRGDLRIVDSSTAGTTFELTLPI